MTVPRATRALGATGLLWDSGLVLIIGRLWAIGGIGGGATGLDLSSAGPGAGAIAVPRRAVWTRDS